MQKKKTGILYCVFGIIGMTMLLPLAGCGKIKEETTETAEMTETADTAEQPPTEPVYISGEFLDLLGQSIVEGISVQMLKPMVSDREVTEAELSEYAEDEVVAKYRQRIEEDGGIFLRADVDNDGTEDLFAWVYSGGTLGTNHRYFLQGQANGSFHEAVHTHAGTQELAFVCYDGINYLVETHFDYNRKAFDGFIVSLYRDGALYETVYVTEAIEEHESEIVYQIAGYKELVDTYAGKKRSDFWKIQEGYSDVFYETIGTAENETEWEESYLGERRTVSGYRSDVDNDGEDELYKKSVFYPTSRDSYMYVNEYCHEEGQEDVRLLEKYALEFEESPLFFWVDRIEDKQILLLYCYDGMEREMLYGFLIEEDRGIKVFEIDYHGSVSIKHDIYTKGINEADNPQTESH